MSINPTPYTFTDPWWFLGLLVLVPMIWRYTRGRSASAVRFPSTQIVRSLRPSLTVRLRHLFFVLRCAALVLLIVAAARPQIREGESKRRTDGLDMMLVVDTSGSMRALDFEMGGRRHDRLEVVKAVLQKFIVRRPDDRLGLVVFGTHAFPQAPLTLDHQVLQTFLERLRIGMAGESTAIGDALAVATNRLKDLDAKSKIVVLLTDGDNKSGRTAPIQVAKAAKAVGVKVYTIGVGSHGPVPIPTSVGIRHQKMEFDEKTLIKVAEITGGRYFRATDTESLEEIYGTIDKLEKTRIETPVFQHYEERFSAFLVPGLVLLLIELMLGLTRIRRLP